jgi:tetraacyldisaccharide 4'-kinase
MPFKTPSFWSQKFHPAALALWPIGKIYQAITQNKIANAKPPSASIPVLCIGNATAGGVGKTPIVDDITERFIAMGITPHIILRGYGGRFKDTTRVDPTVHDAHDVGDEALLHAGVAPTWIGADRLQSANAAAKNGAQVAVMDDGLQNTSIAPSARWLVVDAARGIGNGYGIPAGPLREDFAQALARVDALIVVGKDAFAPQTTRPILRVTIGTDENSIKDLLDKPIYAFAGIGQPARLRASLITVGLDVVGMRGFSDHHTYSAAEIDALHRRAKLLGAALVTTQKDFVRLPENLRTGITPVDVKVTWENEALLQQLLQQVAHAKA